jgi:phosphoribosylformylglycinamidine synthase
MDLKQAGNDLYLVGDFQPVFGGSHFSMLTGQAAQEPVPSLSEITPRTYAALYQAMTLNLIRSAHDLSEGGLAVAAAEMCIGGRLGMLLENNLWDDGPRLLFGETTGTLLVEVRPQDKPQFLSLFEGLPLAWIGRVTKENKLSIRIHGFEVLNLSIPDLVPAWSRAQ